jgi:hypothetical protein
MIYADTVESIRYSSRNSGSLACASREGASLSAIKTVDSLTESFYKLSGLEFF